MANFVSSTAMMACSFGTAPSTLNVLPVKMVNTSKLPAAVITDNIPMVNILPFGLCSSPANPAVIAALGIPQPCTPLTTAPWAPGSMIAKIRNIPALTNQCKCMCAYAGVISIINPGQMIASVKG